jgi:hypothetical protein
MAIRRLANRDANADYAPFTPDPSGEDASMPIDQTIRRLVRDPDALAVIRMIDLFFGGMAKRNGLAADTVEVIVERCWKMMKRGIMGLSDPEADDDDDPFIQVAVTPGQRARARVMGAKLYAVRQYLRRLQNAKMDHLPIQRTEAARGTPTAH